MRLQRVITIISCTGNLGVGGEVAVGVSLSECAHTCNLVCVYVCAHACIRVCMHVRACVCVYVCVYACVCMSIAYDSLCVFVHNDE